MDNNLINFGQHYLINNDFFDILLKTSQISPNDTVIEVGSGDGRLTKLLSKSAKKVYSFEIDDRTKDVLNKLNLSNTEFIFENFLTHYIDFDFNKIVASLPYQITEPFIEKIAKLDFESATLIVGKKFGISASTDENTKLSLFTRCFFKSQYICDVAPENFSPAPKVYSSIIQLTKLNKESLRNKKELFIFRELFEQRDKKLKNALKEALIRFYSHDDFVLTQKESKKLIASHFDESLFEVYISHSTNDIYKQIKTAILSLPDKL